MHAYIAPIDSHVNVYIYEYTIYTLYISGGTKKPSAPITALAIDVTIMIHHSYIWGCDIQIELNCTLSIATKTTYNKSYNKSRIILGIREMKNGP